MSTFLENQNWRYATKKFDSSKKISPEDLNTLKEAIRLSSSSFGLQPYQVIIVENPELRAQLKPASWGQSQIIDASHLIVFACKTDVSNDYIDGYLQNIADTRGLALENVTPYGDYIKGFLANVPAEVIPVWTAKQTYLALANLLNAAAELKIDVTPMEGFVPEQYNEILGLTQLGLNASLVATIGYRSEEDATQHLKKVRKSNDELFITL
ncbi:NAD(P)H-dependent oxidoreductase [Flavobacterium sp.]|jgi:nitroreductase|uniref:NAD(P)H-dependent oxidoreductase n=1 Tax=Flavobacterium sp. TaxID=239 RepID=UPI0038FC9AA6